MIGGNLPIGRRLPRESRAFLAPECKPGGELTKVHHPVSSWIAVRRAEGAGDGLRVRRIPEIPGFQRLQMQHFQTVFHRATAQFPLMEEASFCGIVDEII